MTESPMPPAPLAEKARILRELHQGPGMLVLPNAWDAATARVFETAGFPAIATSSAAVANALGYEDHEGAPTDEMFAAAARITASVSVPVTVDFEAGYQLSPEEFVERAIAAGAAGFNFEDTDHHGSGGLVAPEQQAERIAALKAAARKAGVDLVLNARGDSLLQRSGAREEQIADAVARGKLYLEAGADCVYPIGFYDEETTIALVQGIDGPVNILSWRDGPSLPRLAEIGVRRVTFAGGLFRTLMATLTETATQLRASYSPD